MSHPELIDALKDRLKSESNSGKHAQYQILPTVLAQLLGKDTHKPSSRYEQERFDYISQNVDFIDKSVVDIGCNMGFFSFSAAHCGAKKVICYEGTVPHAEFVQDCANVLNMDTTFEVHPRYFEFVGENVHADVAILLNVLHHLGDDYGDSELNIDQAKKEIINHLNSMHSKCHQLIFQLGFNWRGNRTLPLFSNGTKKELIEYVSQNTQEHWVIENIAVASAGDDGKIAYYPLNNDNIERRDGLGEFLNRPIFIMRSKSIS